MGGAMQRLLDWSDETRHVAVRANAETVEALQTAQSFGAEGIGLARSEHMFFSPERMVALRRLILSEDEDDRAAALTGLVLASGVAATQAQAFPVSRCNGVMHNVTSKNVSAPKPSRSIRIFPGSGPSRFIAASYNHHSGSTHPTIKMARRNQG